MVPLFLIFFLVGVMYNNFPITPVVQLHVFIYVGVRLEKFSNEIVAVYSPGTGVISFKKSRILRTTTICHSKPHKKRLIKFFESLIL